VGDWRVSVLADWARAIHQIVKQHESAGERFDLPAGEFPRLWPIVQAHDEPRVEPEEFARVLKDGSSMAVAAS
jgi:hypothetical protein